MRKLINTSGIDQKARITYLARHLKVQILSQRPLSPRVFNSQLALLVVQLDKVLHNSSRLPDGEIVIVGVSEGGHPAIRIQCEEPILLWVVHYNLGHVSGYKLLIQSRKYLVIGDAEFFENNGDFERVWPRASFTSLAAYCRVKGT